MQLEHPRMIFFEKRGLDAIGRTGEKGFHPPTRREPRRSLLTGAVKRPRRQSRRAARTATISGDSHCAWAFFFIKRFWVCLRLVSSKLVGKKEKKKFFQLFERFVAELFFYFFSSGSTSGKIFNPEISQKVYPTKRERIEKKFFVYRVNDRDSGERMISWIYDLISGGAPKWITEREK